jgi:CRP-like cAMP-binding protein
MMRNFAIFKKLVAQKIKSIYYNFKEINACKDQYLYRQGDKADGVFFIVSG